MSEQNLQFLENSLKKLGVSTRLLSPEEKYNLQKLWRKTFANTLNDKKIDWHTFSYNLVQHIKGPKAIDAFNSQFIKNYFIISSNPKLTGLACEGNRILSYCDLLQIINKSPFLHDLYISHKNFNWTFVITHEEEFGPYFSVLK